MPDMLMNTARWIAEYVKPKTPRTIWLNAMFNILKNAQVITKKDYKIGARKGTNHILLFNTEYIQ